MKDSSNKSDKEKNSLKELQPYLNHSSYHVFFTNLANPLKIGIILSLKIKDKSVTELSKELLVEQSKISHALKTLKNCNIVDVNQKGKQRIYSLNKKTIVPILNIIEKHAKVYCKCKCCTKEDCPGRKKSK